MYLRPALIAEAKTIYETISYSMRYNIVSLNHFSPKQPLLPHLNVNRDNGKHIYEK